MNWGAEWLVLPSGAALNKTKMAPACGDCGETIFTYYESDAEIVSPSETFTVRKGRVVCPKCVRPKPGEEVRGHVDCVRKRFLAPAPARGEGRPCG